MGDLACYETPKSRKLRQDAASGQLVREWFVGGTTDPIEVRDLLALANAVNFYGLSRKSIEIDNLGAPDLWAGTVTYGVSAVPDGLRPDQLSFKVSAGTVHINQSKETVYRLTKDDPNPPVANGGLGSAPDQQGAIGVDRETVHGCDVVVPKMEWTKSVQRASVDFPYLRTVRNLVGKTNNAEFYGFPAGTLLYLGCEPSSAVGTLDDGTKFLFWNVAHSFQQEENQIDVSVGPITIPSKKGFDYVWAQYKPATDAGQLVAPPTNVYVERVYDEGNFALLEIGT